MNTKIVSLCFVVALAGCLDVSSPDGSDVTAEAKIASNSMLPGVIVGNSLWSAPITGSAIYYSGLESTPSGRSYIGYMVDCALSAKQTPISSMYAGNTYIYPGTLGLATAWTTRALTTSEQRYVSACVLARANVFGQPVTISMRGETTALAVSNDELLNYNVEEGAFYGTIFDGRGNETHACNGVDQVRDGDTFGDLPLRQCAQPDPNNPGYTLCGFLFDGNCADVCVRNGDHYSSCAAQTEVITTLLYGTAP